MTFEDINIIMFCYAKASQKCFANSYNKIKCGTSPAMLLRFASELRRTSACTAKQSCDQQGCEAVPGGRIELPWIAPHDFESCASTNSAIPAY